MTTNELPQALRDVNVPEQEEVGRGGGGARGDQNVEAVPHHREAQETAAAELRRDVLQETVTGHIHKNHDNYHESYHNHQDYRNHKVYHNHKNYHNHKDYHNHATRRNHDRETSFLNGEPGGVARLQPFQRIIISRGVHNNSNNNNGSNNSNSNADDEFF